MSRLRPAVPACALTVVFAGAAFLAASLLPQRPARADKIDDLSRALTGDPDFKVRLTAAMVLGKMRDRRGEPALYAGLADRNETVRGMSASALGKLGDPAAAPALERAQSDRSPFVRTSAREALASLRGRAVLTTSVAPTATPARSGRIALALGTLHDKSRIGGARAMQRLRDTLISEIGAAPTVVLGDVSSSQYVIDAVINHLGHKATDRWVEVDADVTFIVARLPSRGIVGMTSGGATMQVPKMSYHPAKEEVFLGEALENAVRGAHPSLVELLRRVQQQKR